MTLNLGLPCVVFLTLATSLAAETPRVMTCKVIDECRSDDGICYPGGGASFRITLAADDKSARIVTPEVDTILQVTPANTGLPVFEGELEGSTLTITWDSDGSFTGIRTSGSGVEHVLRATCRKAAN